MSEAMNMMQFQKILFSEELSQSKVDEAIQQLKSSYDDIEISREILPIISIRYELIPFLRPYIQPVLFRQLPHKDTLFIFKLFQNNIISFIEAKKRIPNYIKKEQGLDIPGDYETQRELHFGGPIASIISQDDVSSLSQLTLNSDFSFDLRLSIDDLRYSYLHIPILHYAAQKGSILCFKYLLLNGSDPQLIADGYDMDWRAIDFASSSGTFEMVKILQEHGYSFTPTTTIAAAQFYQNKMLKWLIKMHPDFDINRTLFTAIQYNNIKAVEICLKSGVNVNSVDEKKCFFRKKF